MGFNKNHRRVETEGFIITLKENSGLPMETLDLIHEKTRRAYNLAAEKYHDLFHNDRF
jgi:hypothetical protein